MQGYVDVDFANETNHRRSTTRYVFTLGTITISWISQLQKIIALYTIEAKYVYDKSYQRDDLVIEFVSRVGI